MKDSVHMIILIRKGQVSETLCSDDCGTYSTGEDRLVKHSVQMIILNRRGQVSESFCSDDCGTY